MSARRLLPDDVARRAASLYQEDQLSTHTIARRLGVGQNAVIAALRRKGVVLRTAAAGNLTQEARAEQSRRQTAVEAQKRATK